MTNNLKPVMVQPYLVVIGTLWLHFGTSSSEKHVFVLPSQMCDPGGMHGKKIRATSNQQLRLILITQNIINSQKDAFILFVVLRNVCSSSND